MNTATGFTLFGIRLVGFNPANARKLLLSLALIALVLVLFYLLRALANVVLRRRSVRGLFWARQAINILTTVLLIFGVASIWFDDPARLTTALGLVTAGLAFALQQVITSVAGYFVLLRGNNFSVGDRIQMGGVRGDVIALGFIQTTILEMGQPPSVQSSDPAMWVKSRQFTGRIVTVANSTIFNTPVFNYTRDFPYIWEEVTLPITYTDDRAEAERVLLTAAKSHAVDPETIPAEMLAQMERKYYVERFDMQPQVYYRITDNWLELTVRFLTEAHGVRGVKNRMSREILQGLDAAGIGIASATYDIVGLPPLRLESGAARTPPAADGKPEES